MAESKAKDKFETDEKPVRLKAPEVEEIPEDEGLKPLVFKQDDKDDALNIVVTVNGEQVGQALAQQPAEVEEAFVVLVTMLANNFEYGQRVNRSELVRQHIDIASRLEKGVLARADDPSPLVVGALQAGAERERSIRATRHEMGVISS